MSESKQIQKEDAKRGLIKAVIAIGKTQDEYAKNRAVEFVRNYDDDECKHSAIKALAIADTRGLVADEVIELIHKFWDTEI